MKVRTTGDVTWPSIAELGAALRRRDVTAADLLARALRVIRARDRIIHAFVHRAAAEARVQAQKVDAAIARGEGKRLSALAGIPCAVKDVLCTAGVPTEAGSRILQGFVPPYDATAVARLKEAGAVIVGKTNLDEFAMGSSTEHSARGPTRHPGDPRRVPGGSSGGSAAAVASGMVPYALGTDTGGSIRQPAAFCGVVGLSPTYGRVSRYGLIAFASSFDQAGPLARSVEDAAHVFTVIAGPDPRDSTTLPDHPPDVRAALRAGAAGLRIGLPKELWSVKLDSAVRATVRAALDRLTEAGATLAEVSLPRAPVALAIYHVLSTAEASANLARYDGIRFGRRPRRTFRTYDALVRAARGAGFGTEVKRRILLGTFGLSAGYADRYYRAAARARHALRDDFQQVFTRVEVLATPTSPELPFRLGEKLDNPVRMHASDILTVPANVAGVPALSVPCGVVRGLPVGLQFFGPPRREDLLFRAGAALERAVRRAGK